MDKHGNNYDDVINGISVLFECTERGDPKLYIGSKQNGLGCLIQKIHDVVATIIPD